MIYPGLEPLAHTHYLDLLLHAPITECNANLLTTATREHPSKMPQLYHHNYGATRGIFNLSLVGACNNVGNKHMTNVTCIIKAKGTTRLPLDRSAHDILQISYQLDIVTENLPLLLVVNHKFRKRGASQRPIGSMPEFWYSITIQKVIRHSFA
jgi:hypothetical protein